MRTSHILVALVVVALLLPAEASAWTLAGTAGDDTIMIGCVGTKLYACANADNKILLETSTSSCALQSNGTVNANGGADDVDILSTSAYYTCNHVNEKWTPPTNNGLYSIAVNGGSGDDDIMGGNVAGTFHGNDGSDRITLRYSYGNAYGDASTASEGDWVDAWGTGTHEELWGGTGDDCLYDYNNAADTFDCGDEFDDEYIGDPTPNDNCELHCIFCFNLDFCV